MAWFKKQKTTGSEVPPRSKVAEGMWLKCNHCREIVYARSNNKVSEGLSFRSP
jgi:acetyl-CoA carboxylase carboxyl transferase subunit beta